MNDLDALFSQAQGAGPAPSAALTARVLAGARQVQAAQVASPVRPSQKSGFLDWLTDLLGGGGPLAGGVLAGFAGLALGFLQPAGLSSLGEVLASESLAGRIELMQGFGALYTEE